MPQLESYFTGLSPLQQVSKTEVMFPEILAAQAASVTGIW
jgi:hypothetical protein